MKPRRRKSPNDDYNKNLPSVALSRLFTGLVVADGSSLT